MPCDADDRPARAHTKLWLSITSATVVRLDRSAVAVVPCRNALGSRSGHAVQAPRAGRPASVSPPDGRAPPRGTGARLRGGHSGMADSRRSTRRNRPTWEEVMCVSETTLKVPFSDERNADLLRLSGKDLKSEAEGKGARAKAAVQEIARRKANRAAAKAAA